jgi:hypothetical protein
MIDNEHLKEMPVYAFVLKFDNQTIIVKDIVLHWKVEDDVSQCIYALKSNGHFYNYEIDETATLEVKK